MATSKKISGLEQYLLRGKLKSEGFERWRYSFKGFNKLSGSEKRFFIEMYLVNPSVSPNVAVIAQKSRVSLNSEYDIQQALSGNSGYDNRYLGHEVIAKPSYLLVKVGVYGKNGKQMNKFIASSQLNYTKTTATFRVGDCIFTSNSLIGAVTVTAADLRVKPELLCNEGSMDWELRYDCKQRCKEQNVLFGTSTYSWVPLGLGVLFAGKVNLDGEEYIVEPEKSYGYIDKSWGQEFSNSYFQLSSSKLFSDITGKQLPSSFFSINGEFGNKKGLAGVICIGSNKYKLGGILGGVSGLKEKHDCIQVPANDGDEKLHWTMSLEQGNTVVDLDIFCNASEMFVRDYEIPQGKKTVMKILGGGSGYGDIKIYKKIGRNLELIESARMNDVICEYGQLDKIGM